MPVVQYQPNQVQSQVVRGARQSTDVPRDTFGIADDSIAIAASQIANQFSQFKQQADLTAAEEAVVQFERAKNNAFFDAENGYFNTQGKNAYDGAETISKSLLDLKQAHGEKLSPRALEAYNRVVDNHITRAQSDIMRHASKGMNAWELSVIESQLENTVENASLYWNQPDKLKVQRVLGEQAVIESANRQGISTELTNERLQTYRSTFAKSVIGSATQSSVELGKVTLDEYGDMLEGPDKVLMTEQIEKQSRIEKDRFDSQQATLAATNLVRSYDDRKSIQDEVNNIEDPELRKKTMSEAMTLFSQREQAESEERGDIFNAAEKSLITGGTVEQWKAVNPDAWDKMTSTQQKALITTSSKADKQTSTDWSVFSDLMILPQKELAQIDPSDYFTWLAEAERGKLVSAVKAARGSGTKSDKVDHQVGRTRVTQTSATLEELLGKKSKWGQAEKDQANAFHSILDSEVTAREAGLNRPLTSEEYTDVLNGLTRSVVIERPYWFDKKMSLTDIPATDQETLAAYLIQNGIPVNADNLIKAWEQARE
jgi:hypothetical protein